MSFPAVDLTMQTQVLLHQAPVVISTRRDMAQLKRARGSQWLLMAQDDFMGCVINGPVSGSNHISSNHKDFSLVTNLGHSTE